MKIPVMKCPYCKQAHGYDELDIWYEGNHRVECQNCEKEFTFHVSLEIQGPDKVEEPA